MPFNGVISLALTGVLNTALDLEVVASQLSKKLTQNFSDGSGINQATNVFSDTRALAASASESLDLAGSLVNALGQTVNFSRIKALAIFAAPGNTNDVVVGGAGANGFASWVGAAAHTVRVKPGGCLLLTAPDANGYAVTPGTGDLLQIANSAGGSGVTYDVVLIGA